MFSGGCVGGMGVEVYRGGCVGVCMGGYVVECV